ncbi:MAG: hypothetical protein ACJ8H8_21950 [Geminicoccaceae bacterium]
MTARGRDEAPTRFRFTATTVARVACPEGQGVFFWWDAGLPPAGGGHGSPDTGSVVGPSGKPWAT